MIVDTSDLGEVTITIKTIYLYFIDRVDEFPVQLPKNDFENDTFSTLWTVSSHEHRIYATNPGTWVTMEISRVVGSSGTLITCRMNTWSYLNKCR